MTLILRAASLAIVSLLFSATAALAQDDAAPAPAAIDKRVFGVLPNYRTADGNTKYESITTRQKFKIGALDSFDKPVYVLAGFYAGIAHLQNSNPSFGQGAKGYANRYVRSLGDTMVGNLMTEAVFPSLLKEDPRYFLLGDNGRTTRQRLGYALTRVLITRTDSGGRRFNFSEFLGNGVSVALSNTYYPETRTIHDNMNKLALQVGTDALSNVLKEFWPDIKRKMKHH